MRYALVLTAAVLFAQAPVAAADPPITFQTQPFDRLLADLRTAATFVGGEKALKALDARLREHLGDKGFEGLDLSRPVVGYVLLDPKPENIAAVIAFPATGEKEFLALVERWNHTEKPKDLGKGLYELPSPDQGNKVRLRFAHQHAYIAFGANPEAALEATAIVPPQRLHDPAETAVAAAKLHFDRLSLGVKAALATLLMDARKKLLEKAELDDADQALLKPAFAELEKLARRYLLLLGGADSLAVRLALDLGTGEATIDTTLTPKPNTELAKQIAARTPSTNQFAGLITPDTVGTFYYSAPLFAPELRTALTASSDHQMKETLKNVPEAAKAAVEELFKGQERTLKSGDFDLLVVVRGPDKDGHYNAILAMSFEDPTAVEKAFRKYIETDGPPEAIGTLKWDADKEGSVSIHTFKVNMELPATVKMFGDEQMLAFAGSPKALFAAIGPNPVATLKEAIKAKPAPAPAFAALVNPARLAKLVEKGGGNPLTIERSVGAEDKLLPATSLKVISGKDLTVRYAMSLRIIPRAIFENLRPDADE